MSSPRFASLTGDFLVRKGEAAPSAILPGPSHLFGRAPERAELPPAVHASHVAHMPAPRLIERTAFAPHVELQASVPPIRDVAPNLHDQHDHHHDAHHHDSNHHDHPDKPRRLMVSLTPSEYETLGIIAVKKGVTRHQLLRMALDDYLEDLLVECGRNCQCVANGWSCGIY